MAHNPHEQKMHAHIESSGEHTLLRRALHETQTLLRSQQIRIEDFRDIYGDDTIAEDLAYVGEKEKEFEAEATEQSRESEKLAVVFEGMFHKGAHELGWLGENALVIKTSNFDDFKHRVDSIVEFQEEDSGVKHLAVGIDVTYSDVLARKFGKIKDGIRKGNLPPIKYFRSGNFRGELQNVPQVVVGAERRNVIALCKDIFIMPDKKRLERHPFQILQLKQMRLELDAFAEYAKRVGQQKMADVYRRDADVVRKILQKKSLAADIRIGELENDRVFAAIKKEVENLK